MENFSHVYFSKYKKYPKNIIQFSMHNLECFFKQNTVQKIN